MRLGADPGGTAVKFALDALANDLSQWIKGTWDGLPLWVDWFVTLSVIPLFAYLVYVSDRRRGRLKKAGRPPDESSDGHSNYPRGGT